MLFRFAVMRKPTGLASAFPHVNFLIAQFDLDLLASLLKRRPSPKPYQKKRESMQN
jgi:hypothetical protein